MLDDDLRPVVPGLRRGRPAGPPRPRAARLPQGRGQDRRHLRHRRRRAVGAARRHGHRRGGRHRRPPRPRLGVHQHRRREGLPRRGRGGAEGPPGASYDALVVGVPDDRWGERVVAVVAPRRRRAHARRTLQDHGRDGLAGYKLPRDLVVVDEIERGPNGEARLRVGQGPRPGRVRLRTDATDGGGGRHLPAPGATRLPGPHPQGRRPRQLGAGPPRDPRRGRAVPSAPGSGWSDGRPSGWCGRRPSAAGPSGWTTPASTWTATCPNGPCPTPATRPPWTTSTASWPPTASRGAGRSGTSPWCTASPEAVRRPCSGSTTPSPTGPGWRRLHRRHRRRPGRCRPRVPAPARRGAGAPDGAGVGHRRDRALDDRAWSPSPCARGSQRPAQPALPGRGPGPARAALGSVDPCSTCPAGAGGRAPRSPCRSPTWPACGKPPARRSTACSTPWSPAPSGTSCWPVACPSTGRRWPPSASPPTGVTAARGYAAAPTNAALFVDVDDPLERLRATARSCGEAVELRRVTVSRWPGAGPR